MPEIERETLTHIYGQETFFTIFSEQANVYDTVINYLKKEEKKQESIKLGKRSYQNFLQTLAYVLNRPTKVTVKRILNDPKLPMPRSISIMKQSLLFKEPKSTVRIYKIAELLKIYLSDVIDCIEDLGVLITRLPAQQYSIMLNNFEKNMQTKAIK